MKTLRTTMGMLLMTCFSMAANAGSMSYYEIRDNARFLTDRMIYELHLRPELIDDLYCINFDYLCGVNAYLDDVARGYRYDDYRLVLRSRDVALMTLLTDLEWRLLTGYDYFYRPIAFVNNVWNFTIYSVDRWNRRLFFDRPRHFDDYRGGRYFGVEIRISDHHNRGGSMNNYGGNMRNDDYMRDGNGINRGGEMGGSNAKNYNNNNSSKSFSNNSSRNNNRGSYSNSDSRRSSDVQMANTSRGSNTNNSRNSGSNVSANHRSNYSGNSGSNTHSGSNRGGGRR